MRTTIVAAAAAAFTLGTAGCTIDLSSWRPGAETEQSPSPTPVSAGPVLDAALAALEEAPAIQLQGQFSDPEDTTAAVDTMVTVTDSGATSGTFQTGSGEARYIEADRKLFVDADDDYWLTTGIFNPDSDTYADNWVRTSPEQFGLDPGAVLTPGRLAESLRAQAPGEGAQAVEEKLDGAVTYRVDLAGGKVWISAEEPYQLIRMQVEELAPADGEGVASRIDADFVEVDTAAVEQLYGDLATIAEDELGSARDARMEVGWEGDLGGNCETGGACTMIGTITDVGGASEGSVRVRMDSVFSNDELGEKKCDKTGELEAGGTVELSCSVDFGLAPSTNPQTYQISYEAFLSTRALSGDAREDLVGKIGEQREATLSGGAGGEAEEGN
ncbi:hypothetical protein [Actinorugispora endophytica]|uniref:hypothetical protein n=1 Tax=Actinorugispora endophytica TaxID=1605990 RepID=UPI001FB57C0A|nr:hypothetical protein [Actinorugispora endophytica]